MSFTVSLSVLGVQGRRELDQQDNIPTYNSAIRCLLKKKTTKQKPTTTTNLLRGTKLTSEMGEIILLRKT